MKKSVIYLVCIFLKKDKNKRETVHNKIHIDWNSEMIMKHLLLNPTAHLLKVQRENKNISLPHSR